jgi:hypothetical protein
VAKKKPTSVTKKTKVLAEHAVVLPARATKAKPADTVYQFKITLLESHPPIWRRIQVQDCTLDKLHEHIQTAMGWTNSHLHHFRIGEQLYGDPDLMQENFEDMEYQDSTATKVSDVLPRTGRRFRFQYERGPQARKKGWAAGARPRVPDTMKGGIGKTGRCR